MSVFIRNPDRSELPAECEGLSCRTASDIVVDAVKCYLARHSAMAA